MHGPDACEFNTRARERTESEFNPETGKSQLKVAGIVRETRKFAEFQDAASTETCTLDFRLLCTSFDGLLN